MNRDLVTDLDEVRQIDAGCVRSTDPRVGSWHSSLSLVERGSPYTQFMWCTGLACKEMWSEFGIAGDSEINALWSIITPPGGSNVPLKHWAGNPDSRRYAHSDLSVEPLPGRIVIFPSWIQHYVEPNLSGCDRVVLAFNVIQTFNGDEVGH